MKGSPSYHDARTVPTCILLASKITITILLIKGYDKVVEQLI